MENNFKHKQEIIDFLKSNYPFAVKAEFECGFDQGIVTIFKRCYLYDASLNKKPINGSSFYGPYENNIIILIEQNDIILEDNENSILTANVTIDLVNDIFVIDFHELVEDKQYIGTFKI
jgi:hypothetical protein